MCIVHRILSKASSGQAISVVKFDEKPRGLAPYDEKIYSMTFTAPADPLAARLRRRESQKRGTVPINPLTYVNRNESKESYCEDFLDDADIGPTRIKTAATEEQRDAREKRNRTRKVVTTGRRKPTEVEFIHLPHTRKMAWDATVGQCETHDTEHIYHDSHGYRGRKPAYKDHRSVHGRA